MRLTGFLCAGLFVLAACSPQSSSTAAPAATAALAPHPISGLQVIPLTVRSGNKVHQFRVEIARSGQEQAQGLMFRTTMGADEGMVFPMDPTRDAAFWMKNTVIPLDIIFIGADRRILNIAANTVPYSEAPVPSAGPVSAVLELVGGRAAQLGIAPGDRAEW